MLPLPLTRVPPQMPLCDGLQATREIREYERQRGVAGGGLVIIGLTANASDEDRRARWMLLRRAEGASAAGASACRRLRPAGARPLRRHADALASRRLRPPAAAQGRLPRFGNDCVPVEARPP